MDLHLTPEQALLRDSAARFAAAAASAARHRRDGAPSRQRLREAGELGWLAMLVPEAKGGLGLGLTELALVSEQAGRGLLGEPIGLAAVSAAAVAQMAEPHPLTSRVLCGEALVVPALEERAFGDDPHKPATRAVAEGARWRLTGGKRFVVCGAQAEGFLVSAAAPGGTVLYLVARDAPGAALAEADSVDGGRLGTLDLAGAPAAVVPPHPSSGNAVAALHDLALVAVAAELLGVMAQAQRITLDHLRLRKQFGKPIGSFQALQHQAANMHLRTEAVRSLIFQIAATSDPWRIDPAMAAAAKAKASDDALSVTKACIQLHGAIGFTDEHDAGRYLKRAMVLSSLLGNAAMQRRRFAALAGLTA